MYNTILQMRELEINSLLELGENSDGDECDPNEIRRIFTNWDCICEQKLNDTEYILNITATRLVEYLILKLLFYCYLSY